MKLPGRRRHQNKANMQTWLTLLDIFCDALILENGYVIFSKFKVN